METIKTKQEYIDAWRSHVDVLKILCWTPSNELSKEVTETIDKMNELVEKVADDKGLQSEEA